MRPGLRFQLEGRLPGFEPVLKYFFSRLFTDFRGNNYVSYSDTALGCVCECVGWCALCTRLGHAQPMNRQPMEPHTLPSSSSTDPFSIAPNTRPRSEQLMTSMRWLRALRASLLLAVCLCPAQKEIASVIFWVFSEKIATF